MFVKFGQHVIRLSQIVHVSKTVRHNAGPGTTATTRIHLRNNTELVIHDELEKVLEKLNAASNS